MITNKLFFLLILVFSFSLMATGQPLSLVTPLANSVKESSGLIYLNGRLITHNDSGGASALYELDTLSGNISRSVVLSNATNNDWEDICEDGTYIYVADFGNNNGNRTNLKVYRLLIADYLSTTNDSVLVDTISFGYADQTDFSSSTFSTNFDAEALIAYGDSLYVFTKNWGDNWTNIYALPKVPGNYSIPKIDSIDVQGLITGGTYDAAANSILLSGYTVNSPFLVEVKDFVNTSFSEGTVNRITVTPPSGYSIQIESITHLGQDQYFLTAEDSFTGDAGLFRWENLLISGLESLVDVPYSIYPNPASNFIQLDYSGFASVEIYDMLGVLHKRSTGKRIDLLGLEAGMYLVVVRIDDQVYTERLIVW